MSINVTALKPHTYAGKRRKPGDTYPVRGRSDLAVIKALGWGFEAPHIAPPAPVAQRQTYHRADLVAQAPTKARRTYKRRDLVADPAGSAGETAAAPPADPDAVAQDSAE